jgi:hypothetical protein
MQTNIYSSLFSRFGLSKQADSLNQLPADLAA